MQRATGSHIQIDLLTELNCSQFTKVSNFYKDKYGQYHQSDSIQFVSTSGFQIFVHNCSL